MKILISALLIVVVLGGSWLIRARKPVTEAPAIAAFTVTEGEGAKAIAGRLEDADLIRSKSWFLFLVWRRDSAAEFKPGTFDLSPSMTPDTIERTLTQGLPLSNERQITVLEGWNLDEIAAYFEKQGVMSRAGLEALAGRRARLVSEGEIPTWDVFDAVGARPATASLEGYLFPDTYRIFVDASAEDVMKRMLNNFEEKLTPGLRAEIAASGHTVHEIVVMASVLEREVRGEKDMAIVSDLFWRRVEAGMGLEADSTVNYCTGKSLPAVTYADLQVECPWNTYKYRGLPAGPIGNPGLLAIEAAVHRDPNDYWYFLTDDEGTVYYAKTLNEHNANKAKYLK